MDEKFYANKSSNNISLQKELEEKIIKFQKQMEERYKTDLENEKHRFKELEISSLKIDMLNE